MTVMYFVIIYWIRVVTGWEKGAWTSNRSVMEKYLGPPKKNEVRYISYKDQFLKSFWKFLLEFRKAINGLYSTKLWLYLYCRQLDKK